MKKPLITTNSGTVALLSWLMILSIYPSASAAHSMMTGPPPPAQTSGGGGSPNGGKGTPGGAADSDAPLPLPPPPPSMFPPSWMPSPNAAGSYVGEIAAPAPGATDWACKVLVYGGDGTTVTDVGGNSDHTWTQGTTLCGFGPAPPGSVSCYIPKVTGDAEGDANAADVGVGAVPNQSYSTGWCYIPTTNTNPSTTLDNLPPATALNVDSKACTRSPPSTWYDPDAPVDNTAKSWAEPTEPNGMKISDIPINTIAPSWLPRAQGIASKLFTGLFIFEIFLLGLYALLHGHDITHLFSSFAFKTFILTFFMYLMSNSPTILPSIINSFKIAGQTTGATDTKNLMDMYHQTDSAAELFFCAAMASHIDDQETALEYGYFGQMTSGRMAFTDDAGSLLKGTIGHITFEFIVQGLGMLVIAGTGIMFLSLALLTAESYITMFAGVFFMGLSSMRFTLPFTQGYLAYTLNVGVKLLTYWVLIAVETNVLLPVLTRAGVGLINAASIKFGAQPAQSEELYLVYAGVDVAQILALGALTWFLPNVTGRFVSNRNSIPAIKVIVGMAKTIKEASLSIAGRSSLLLPESVNPAPLLRNTTSIAPFQENAAAIRHSTTSPPITTPDDPFLSESRWFNLPSSPMPGGGAAALLHVGPSSLGKHGQSTQVSVSGGPDPFALTQKKPIVLSSIPQRKQSVSNPVIQQHMRDELASENAVANILNPNPSNPSTVIGFSSAISRQNADARSSQEFSSVADGTTSSVRPRNAAATADRISSLSSPKHFDEPRETAPPNSPSTTRRTAADTPSSSHESSSTPSRTTPSARPRNAAATGDRISPVLLQKNFGTPREAPPASPPAALQNLTPTPNTLPPRTAGTEQLISGNQDGFTGSAAEATLPSSYALPSDISNTVQLEAADPDGLTAPATENTVPPSYAQPADISNTVQLEAADQGGLAESAAEDAALPREACSPNMPEAVQCAVDDRPHACLLEWFLDMSLSPTELPYRHRPWKC